MASSNFPTSPQGLLSPVSYQHCPSCSPSWPPQGLWLAAAPRWVKISPAKGPGTQGRPGDQQQNKVWGQMLPRNCFLLWPSPLGFPSQPFSLLLLWGQESLWEAPTLPGPWRPHGYSMGGLQGVNWFLAKAKTRVLAGVWGQVDIASMLLYLG